MYRELRRGNLRVRARESRTQLDAYRGRVPLRQRPVELCNRRQRLLVADTQAGHRKEAVQQGEFVALCFKSQS